MSEPREWWIDPQPCDEDMPDTFDAFRFHPGQGPLQWQVSLVHVIEYSAYEAAEAKLKDATETINEMQNIIRRWINPNSLIGTEMQDAFNIGCRFNSAYTDLFNAYLENRKIGETHE